MSKLQKKMADFGFESNDDYEYHLRCLMNNPSKGIKTINIEGHKGRRKTAFANALARALEYSQLFYYDFTQKAAAEGKVIIPPSEDEHGITEAPVSDFDHIMSEACAFSEGEQTVLILDQLHIADFKDHIRIYHFIKNREWSYGNNSLKASHKNLLILLISDDPLYHSLQKCSFRVWVNTVSSAQKDYAPADFELNDDVLPVMESLAVIFDKLEMAPTHSEYKNILNDIHLNVHTEQQLIHSLYGWMEGIDRGLLFSKEMQALLVNTIDSINRYHGVDEVTIES
ncbi:MAG: hypothetical protein GY694_07780 [Gammaproteobacteria bacterium]|nr:hypothetical protein [Gammaproteobacteria bacterium]